MYTIYMHDMGNKQVSFILTRDNFGNVTVTFLGDAPSRETSDNHYV